MTKEERAILAHVIVDPDEWYENVLRVFTTEASGVLAAKVDKHKSSYLAAVTAKGSAYKTRVERETT